MCTTYTLPPRTCMPESDVYCGLKPVPMSGSWAAHVRDTIRQVEPSAAISTTPMPSEGLRKAR